MPKLTNKNLASSLEESPPAIVYGVFKAMGDLLCASPVLAHELASGATIHLLLFPSAVLVEFLDLIDFGEFRSRLHVHFVPAARSISGWRRFVAEMKSIAPSRVWISPHAPREASSWRIPVVLQIIRTLYWRAALLTGADSERGAFALNRKIPLDRSLPFIQREWQGYRMAFSGLPERVESIRFIPQLMKARDGAPEFDLLIHPGANAKNRSWPAENFGALVRLLPASMRIGVLGLPSDIAMMRQMMPDDRGIRYRSGTLAEAIATIASARLLLTMDSGNVHFAQTLGVPTVALFGKSDPVNIISIGGTVDAIYQLRFPCQPCGSATCRQAEVYCMNAISPQAVATRILLHYGS